jgi:hypothetical protein
VGKKESVMTEQPQLDKHQLNQKRIMELAIELCGKDKSAVLALLTQCIQGILIVDVADPAGGLRVVAEHFMKAANQVDARVS